ncbi:hypothetical protein SCATT_p01010 (plasmid) [Streptantibioticus cattleyicolor NRRL 8057 = DSM 46488]|uniref:Uncharacterized protein n=1 Tax=Streptantibioticus cattleyicolor (strain ATCC 35852 / DSM 46488 / JCM 4925 / NBRC 14057 / NRRL 8057) TaxID=1003195 RepID=G8XE31_STREN|nr:hypothetical protein SCATT_p01010 [Streptantibioticus cattleyicolor NRRL 8057 = DSM 46488]
MWSRHRWRREMVASPVGRRLLRVICQYGGGGGAGETACHDRKR